MKEEIAITLDDGNWRSLVRREALLPSMARADKPDNLDLETLRGCQAGDESAYRELLGRYQKKAFWIAYNMIHDAEEARDIAQEAFVRVFRSIGSYDPDRNFYTWLYRIVMNLAIDRLRKRSVDRSLAVENGVLSERIPGGSGPERTLQQHELSEHIESVLARLPSKYRAVIVLRDIDQLSCKDIAKITKCTHATVRWRLHKARKLFREQWEKRYPGEEP